MTEGTGLADEGAVRALEMLFPRMTEITQALAGGDHREAFGLMIGLAMAGDTSRS